MKKFLLIFLLFVTILCSAYRKPYRYTINAEKDAFYHNNVGINYLQDRIYYAAIQEFKIAIQLSPNTQATAVFKNNLGETYNYIGYPDMARVCFEDALKLYGLNFKYYLNLADTYERLNIVNTKMEELKSSQNLYDKIMLGILYTRSDKKKQGIILLDEICQQEPDILITPAIKQYLKEMTSDKQRRNYLKNLSIVLTIFLFKISAIISGSVLGFSTASLTNFCAALKSLTTANKLFRVEILTLS